MRLFGSIIYLRGTISVNVYEYINTNVQPENVMLKKRGEAQVKLIDFGLSRRIPPGASVKDMIGTPEFVGESIDNFEKRFCLNY